MAKHRASLIGVDLSTTKTGIAVRSAEGEEDYADVENRGAVKWSGEPAFDLSHQPKMLVEALKQLSQRGWTFDKPGALSLSVRQHDLALVDSTGALLMPALTWQCHAAAKQVKALRGKGVEKQVGRIEERFILPKLAWVLEKKPAWRKKIGHAMTTGDWVAWQLTGEMTLSTSDALSNGLLEQSTRTLATAALEKAELNPDWFPTVRHSGEIVGQVAGRSRDDFAPLRKLLPGWRVVAGLGDNHATGVGTGGLVDRETIVVSAGTSGTINRRAPATGATPAADMACFEFYHDRLLLLMLADCGQWYTWFKDRYPSEISDAEFSLLAMYADPQRLARVRLKGQKEILPGDWSELSLGEKTGSIQYSILLELLERAAHMDRDVSGVPEVKRFILTGGLSQSPLMQHLFEAGVQRIVGTREVSVQVSDRAGKLAQQTAAYGALINASLPEHGGDLVAAAAKLCRFKPCPSAPPARREALVEAIARGRKD